jgi:hypothetical protein
LIAAPTSSQSAFVTPGLTGMLSDRPEIAMATGKYTSEPRSAETTAPVGTSEASSRSATEQRPSPRQNDATEQTARADVIAARHGRSVPTGGIVGAGGAAHALRAAGALAAGALGGAGRAAPPLGVAGAVGAGALGLVAGMGCGGAGCT